MTLSMTHIAKTAAIIVLASFTAWGSSVNAAVPSEIEDRLRQIAGTWRANAEQQNKIQQVSGNPHMAAFAGAMDRRVSGAMMSQAVMEAITRDPTNAGDATEAALRAAPELRREILGSLSTAFPTMYATFAAAENPVRPRPPRAARALPTAAIAVPPARPVVVAPAETRQIAAEPDDMEADRDPYANVNRAIFSFNDVLDTYLMVPIAKAYRFIMPETLRGMGRNFFKNLNEPVVAINDILQGDLDNAGISLGRFVVNSTIGLFGFFEVAERIDLKPHPADFGQTLYTYGVGPGPYIMLPFFGPSTARNVVGTAVDSFLNPISYFLDFETRLYLKGSELVVKRESILDELAELKKGSLDYYPAVRSAWFQNRERVLRKGAPPSTENIDKLFEDVK